MILDLSQPKTDKDHKDNQCFVELWKTHVKFAVQKLWNLDTNRLTPGVDYDLNLPVIRQKGDNTPEHLFKFVSNKPSKMPTFQLFYHLLDNYIPETGIPEEVDTHELSENQAFIKACLQTAPMIYTYNYLKAKGKFHGTEADFEKELDTLWFKLYRREGRGQDSSAFEHVFVGEIRNGEAKAFHNWITLYFYEKAGKIDYEGFVPSKNEKPDPTSHVIPIRFTFKGALKPFSTSFIGTAPEFELSMYTLLFYFGKQDTRVILDDINLNIKIYPFYEKGGDGSKLIGSAFPEIV
ncbi:14739_t:CDS:2 [Funneliformis geosporum]|uniref:17620_t:CDS:1 n=1 Tax=Funneliformis geosporum TaxID=1117311 RepID=A0A9W4WYF9_9GLOM|nr:17620_t:CDS:2 [Funneliformis geosporum]CAI2188677.1 14739_t:CDS:2 [Funneliformis geosporum]